MRTLLPPLLLSCLSLVAGRPNALARNNCAKAVSLATGPVAQIMGETPTLGIALTVSGANGLPIRDGATYTPGEILSVATSGAGDYAFYATGGSFGAAALCQGKLMASAPGSLTTPIAGGTITVAAARSSGPPGSGSPVIYQRVTLTAAPGVVTPPIGTPPPPPQTGIILRPPPPPGSSPGSSGGTSSLSSSMGLGTSDMIIIVGAIAVLGIAGSVAFKHLTRPREVKAPPPPPGGQWQVSGAPGSTVPPPPPGGSGPPPGAPPALPAGWEQHIDPVTRRPYFFNDTTGQTSWLAPGPNFA